MSKFSVLHPMIKAVVSSSIPTFTMTDAIREAARMFCVKTVIAQEKVFIYTEPEIKEYQLRVFNENVVNILVLAVEAEGKPYHIGYSCPNTQSIIFDKPPGKDDELTITVAVKPSLIADCLEYGLLDEYAEILRDGTLSVIYAQAGSEWHNPEAGEYYKSKFYSAINDIIINRTNGFTNQHEVATGDKW